MGGFTRVWSQDHHLLEAHDLSLDLGPRGHSVHFAEFTLLLTLIDHSDWLEGAEGPRQSGASTRGPRRGELEGGRRPPSCEF